MKITGSGNSTAQNAGRLPLANWFASRAVLAFGIGLAMSFGQPNSAQAVPLIAVTADGQVAQFDSATPQTTSLSTISGLAAGESFLAVDLRPSNNQIYGISTANKLYTLNSVTGSATLVATLSTPVFNAATPTKIEIDFNPVADRGTGASLRVVGADGSNYAVNVATGAVTVATSIATGTSAIAYTNSDASQPAVTPASTQLFYVNAQSDKLFVANSAFNTPILNLVGDLGVDVSAPSALEIVSGGLAFLAASTTNSLRTALFNVNLSTGALSQIGSFASGITSLTSGPANVPLPGTLALLLGAFALVSLRSVKSSRLK